MIIDLSSEKSLNLKLKKKKARVKKKSAFAQCLVYINECTF